ELSALLRKLELHERVNIADLGFAHDIPPIEADLLEGGLGECYNTIRAFPAYHRETRASVEGDHCHYMVFDIRSEYLVGLDCAGRVAVADPLCANPRLFGAGAAR